MARIEHPELTALLEKYGRPAPRYTSYPPIPYWGTVTADDVTAWLAEGPSSGALSLYTHIPFCTKRCWYCACSVVITPLAAPVHRYLSALLREMALVRERLGPGRTVSQYHLGGGTPTTLRPQDLTRLVQTARSLFDFEDGLEMSIELDPRTVSPEDLAHLRSLGFNRLSFGVQDFDERVQVEVNRILPYGRMATLMEAAGTLGYLSVNFDLIYGLPGQNRERFARTIDRVIELHPHRLAIYNFAYLPDRFPHQGNIAAANLPEPRARTEIIMRARTQLERAGYVPLGLDHFALKQDTLAAANRHGTMQRNFMGYTTQAGTDLLAFGLTGISEFNGCYWQNEKKLSCYERAVTAGRLPVARGKVLDADDRLRQAAISALFCRGRVDFYDLEQRFCTGVDGYFAEELEALIPLARDGLVEVHLQGVAVTELGRHFLRNIALIFDRYAKHRGAESVGGYSSAV